MHHLIKSMHKYLREAISNDGGFIYYWQFLLLYCSMSVFNIIRLFIFSFILQLAVLFIFIIWIFILALIIIAKTFKKFNSSQFPRLYALYRYIYIHVHIHVKTQQSRISPDRRVCLIDSQTIRHHRCGWLFIRNISNSVSYSEANIMSFISL